RQSIHNTFVVRSIVNVSLNLQVGPQGGALTPVEQKFSKQAEMFRLLPSTRRNCAWLQVAHQMIFFCDQPLEVQATPAFLHRTEAQTRISFLPRVFDCGRWIKSIEAVFEVPNTVTSLQLRVQEPLYYLRFNTPEPIQLVRFQVVPELFETIIGCSNYPRFRPHSTLERAYTQLQDSEILSRVGSLIRSHTVAGATQ
ncbi:MAG TPA: hypothetical protein PK402_00585, partial [Tepidisphaeraceae bacterium]|nr:hypothetical protein [Tepidisphaeraceae bacterium]